MVWAEMRCRYDKVFGEGREARCEIDNLLSFTLLNYLGDRLEAMESNHNSRTGYRQTMLLLIP
jgi:hypothetical protein